MGNQGKGSRGVGAGANHDKGYHTTSCHQPDIPPPAMQCVSVTIGVTNLKGVVEQPEVTAPNHTRPPNLYPLPKERRHEVSSKRSNMSA
jgi:hypothetical protein